MGNFCNIIQFETHGDVTGAELCVEQINTLCEAGKAGRFVNHTEHRSSNWEKLCALEDALVDADSVAHGDYIFIVGNIIDDEEVNGWLEYEDIIIVPYGPQRQAQGSDVGVYHREVFDDLEYVIHAIHPCADDSAIHLNAIVRDLYGTSISFKGEVR